MWQRIKRFILPVVLLGVILVFLFVKFYIFRESSASVASKKADVEIAAGDLLNNYEKDESASNTKYLNKVILVKGMIDNISETQSNYNVYIKDRGNTSGVMCSFDKKEFQKNPLKSGELANIKGICNGYLMDVIMNKCAVER